MSFLAEYSLIDYILSIIDNAVDASSFWRGNRLHNESLRLDYELHEASKALAEKLHEEALNLSKEQHEESINFARIAHMRAMNNALEIHYHELNADLINATREAERSMYDQRNAEFQTLIISSTVMFAALSTVIVQGYLPTTAPQYVYELSAFTCGMSFTLLFIGIVLFTKIVVRTSKFMYHRANAQTERVYSVIESAMELMKEFRYHRGIMNPLVNVFYETTSTWCERHAARHSYNRHISCFVALCCSIDFSHPSPALHYIETPIETWPLMRWIGR